MLLASSAASLFRIAEGVVSVGAKFRPYKVTYNSLDSIGGAFDGTVCDTTGES
jgi:hypothetical protein